MEDKIQDMKLGPNPNKPRKRQIKAMGLSEINAMMFYLARRGEHKSLKLLSTIHNLDFNLKDDEGRTALTYAAIGNRRECLEDLLKRGSLADSFDSSGRTALHWASYYGCDVSVEWLVKYRADMTYSDYQGRTCFHCATYPEKSKTLAYLLRKFPAHQHVDFLDEERMTPLMWAAFYGNEENVKLLLKRGASAYLKDIDGKTALHWTSSNRHCNAVRILVEFDPKLAAETDNLGRVPLHLASGEGNVSIVNLLLKLKVTKESIRDNSRRTPLHWAAGKKLMLQK